MMSEQRRGVLEAIAQAIEALPANGVRRVAIDGVDGAGKTTFADELSQLMRSSGVTIIRAGVDGFHRPAADRYRRGRHSPDGFYLDSYDYDRLRDVLLSPLGPGGDRRFTRAVHDVATDRPIDGPWQRAEKGAVLLFDGIFLHRPQLRSSWDLSVFLEVSVEESVRRCADRDGSCPDPADARNRRYVEGQRRYLDACQPQGLSTFVVDNEDLRQPTLRTP